jgi:glycosyltransferase involved in cell wall biosynthesis
VLTVYGIEVFTGRFRYFTKLCLGWADHVICISSATQRQMEEQFGEAGPATSSVIPFGVPNEFLDEQSSAFNVRVHHGLPEDSILVLSVGRLIERKGVEYLIRATPRLDDPKTHVIVAGGGADLERLQRLAKELDVSERITFTDFVPGDRLPAYYSQCDVFVHPVITDSDGDVEGLGLVILEAMAAGKPTVASGIGGITDVVVDGETGYLIPEKNEGAIVERVSALAADHHLREEMGAAAKRRVEEHFAAADRAADVMHVYESLMKESAA